MRGFAKFNHTWLETFIPQLPAREGIILYLESRAGLNQQHDFGRLMTATKKSARTLERAIADMVRAGELVVKDGLYFVGTPDDKSADKGEAQTPTNMATETPTNLSEIAPENAVPDEQLQPRKKLKEGKEVEEVKQTPPTPPKSGGDLGRVVKSVQAKLEPKTKPEPHPELELPDWLPCEAWQDWLAYRHERRLTCNLMTLQAQILELHGFLEQGMDLERIVRKSISSGWQGLFGEKTNGYRSGAPPQQTRAKINDEDVWKQAELEQDAFIATLGVNEHGRIGDGHGKN